MVKIRHHFNMEFFPQIKNQEEITPLNVGKEAAVIDRPPQTIETTTKAGACRGFVGRTFSPSNVMGWLRED